MQAIMEFLNQELVAGILVVVFSAVGGYLIKKFFFRETKLLPISHVPEDDYSSLNGLWYIYWLSYDPKNPTTPVWMQGKLKLRVKGNMVYSDYETTEQHVHPGLSFSQRSEIHAGHMMDIAIAERGPAQITMALYPDIRHPNAMVGIWMGRDNLGRPIAAPVIRSRNLLEEHELTQMLDRSGISLVPIGKYESYEDK